MAFWDRWFSNGQGNIDAPKASGDGGKLISTPQELREVISGGGESSSGELVTPNSALKLSAVFACVRIISGSVATLPLHIKRRVDERTREDASDSALWQVMRRRPNGWQKPHQFRRMMQAHILLRGNAYALIVRNAKKEVHALIPLHPDRIAVKQLADLSIEYSWTRPDGRQVVLPQSDVFHLFGLSFDGITGVTPITYARETIGLSTAMERHGGKTFKNGAVLGHVLRHPGKLGGDAIENLRNSLESYRSGGDREGKDLILEEGMDLERMAMTAADAQWIESRKFSRTDIFMFFGIPPHMAGDTEKSTSWGTGIEAQQQGFLAFTLEDHLTMWEEGITVDLTGSDHSLYARFNRAALVRADTKTRWEAYAKARQMKVFSANDIRALEDLNPVEGGDTYENPMITVDKAQKGDSHEPS